MVSLEVRRSRPTPTVFPRNCWLSQGAFGWPPYRSGSFKHQACWAARQASMIWSRVLGRPGEIDEEGNELVEYREQTERPDATIDDTCFMLAIFDKVWEM